MPNTEYREEPDDQETEAKQARLAECLALWDEYAAEVLVDTYIKAYGIDKISQRMIDAGYTTQEYSNAGKAAMRPVIAREVIETERKEMYRLNSRLTTLVKLFWLTDNEVDIENSTIISIGGGPGDSLFEPWLPRLASLIVGAQVINFDHSPVHPIDKDLDIYTHVGGSAGDIFKLLLNEISLVTNAQRLLLDKKSISIIECNGLIGTKVSIDLGLTLQVLDNDTLINHPKIIQMRQNLVIAAQELLMEGGVLAIDDAYWKKVDGELQPVMADGTPRTVKVYDEEVL